MRLLLAITIGILALLVIYFFFSKYKNPRNSIKSENIEPDKMKNKPEPLGDSNIKISESRLARSLDAMQQGVLIYDENCQVIFTNSKAKSLMKQDPGEEVALHAVNELVGLAASGIPGERTLDLYGPPRKTLNIRAHSIDDGRLSLGIIAIIEDISERRRLESVRRDFISNVSHELKTPIGALALLAETLTTETEPIVAQRLADRIHAEAFRISRVIEDLLDLTRIEAEESPPRDPIPVGLIMAEAIERVRPVAEQQKVGLDVEEPPPELTVLGDRRQLVSALFNLLENAVKYSVEPKKVEFRAINNDNFIDLTVKDRGLGIPSKDLERIFERFYRVDPGRGRSTGGTGLGLAIVRHVANNHQGEVLVESHEGQGSTFTLRLPRQSFKGVK